MFNYLLYILKESAYGSRVFTDVDMAEGLNKKWRDSDFLTYRFARAHGGRVLYEFLSEMRPNIKPDNRYGMVSTS